MYTKSSSLAVYGGTYTGRCKAGHQSINKVFKEE